jgi:hypothetical protein
MALAERARRSAAMWTLRDGRGCQNSESIALTSGETRRVTLRCSIK